MIPNIWTSTRGHLHQQRLRSEAITCSLSHRPPANQQEWEQQAADLKKDLIERLHIVDESAHPLDPCFHRETVMQGGEKPYRVVAVSYSVRPGVRVTANLYIPEGDGPFPAVLNLHGHFTEGKLGDRVQTRGHAFAQRGFVVLSVDTFGAGERSPHEREWFYHGAMAGAGMILAGDSLLACQVRDNRRAIDFLESLSYVDRERIGVTGASGGGNQTMWVAAMDERLKVAIPVVSVGSFEAYVGRCNCICETLPGGLPLTEEWGILGLIAPRPLLVLNALHDQVAFGVEALSATASVTQEIYSHFGKRERFDHRIFDRRHGYWPPMLEAALAWFQYWLQGVGPGTPAQLPQFAFADEETLLCYEKGTRPEELTSYIANRRTLLQAAPKAPSPDLRSEAEQRAGLAALVGWDADKVASAAAVCFPLRSGGVQTAIVQSPRATSLPVVYQKGQSTDLHVILSPAGKQSPFVSQQWEKLAGSATVLTLDLPAVGELSWEKDAVRDAPFHDSGRACLWMGYTLVGEWAEALSSLLQASAQPGAHITLHADGEMALAALIALALTPTLSATVVEHNTPRSFEEIYEQLEGSIAWIIPGVIQWGDLDLLRKLARQS